MLKLNQNQHTLAGSMDQWRTDSAADVANILNRLTSIDRDNALPVETLNGLNAHMDTMNRLIIERYHRRNRFRYWLFGTDDWIGASWPSQKAAIEAERQRVKSVAACVSADPAIQRCRKRLVNRSKSKSIYPFGIKRAVG